MWFKDSWDNNSILNLRVSGIGEPEIGVIFNDVYEYDSTLEELDVAVRWRSSFST